MNGAGPQHRDRALRLLQQSSFQGNLACRVSLRSRVDRRLGFFDGLIELRKSVLLGLVKGAAPVVAIDAGGRDDQECACRALKGEELAGMGFVISHHVDQRIGA